MNDPVKPSKEKVDKAVSSLEEIASRAFGTGHGPRALRLLNQAIRATRAETGSDAQTHAIVAIVRSLETINPKDEMERMLAVQMIGTHEQAMECLSRATLLEQTFEGRDLNLKHAEKLLQIYTRQVEALDKHRGKGQQKITVEHVTVEAGGQAIVGNVETKKTTRPTNISASAVLEHQPDGSVPIEFAPARKEAVPVRRTAKQRLK